MNSRAVQNAAVLAAAVAAALAAVHAHTDWLAGDVQAQVERERCYGVVRAGKNDCATSQHSCAAQATRDGDPEEWLMLPVNLCAKIAGGGPGSM